MTRRSARLAFDDPRLADFWGSRRLATLTTLRRDGAPHTVPVAPVVDPGGRTAVILASDTSLKVRNIERAETAARVTICEVEGPHWVTIEGRGEIVREPMVIAEAERRYAARFRQPRVNPHRVVIVVTVDRLLGHLPS